jgi:hypothetical protein
MVELRVKLLKYTHEIPLAFFFHIPMLQKEQQLDSKNSLILPDLDVYLYQRHIESSNHRIIKSNQTNYSKPS